MRYGSQLLPTLLRLYLRRVATTVATASVPAFGGLVGNSILVQVLRELHLRAHGLALVERGVALVGEEGHAHRLDVLSAVELLRGIHATGADGEEQCADAVELHLVAINF